MNKAMFLGLDGVPFTLLEKLVGQGLLPNLAGLASRGFLSPLDSPVPISPAAWTTIATGGNPMQHGIFDFQVPVGGYQMAGANASHSRLPTIWEVLSAQGVVSVVGNFPICHPFKPFDNVTIAPGWMAPQNHWRDTHPAGLAEELMQAGYEFCHPKHSLNLGYRGLLDEAFETLEQRALLARFLLHRVPDWQLFCFVFFETDLVLHRLFDHLGTGNWIDAEVVRYFQRLDQIVGELVEAAGADTKVLLCSDHGMGLATPNFAVNTWLLESGLMRVKNDPVSQLKYHLWQLGLLDPDRLRNLRDAFLGGDGSKRDDPRQRTSRRLGQKLLFTWDNIDWGKTTAFAVGAAIYLNMAGRQSHGWVKNADQVIAQILTQACRQNRVTIRESGEVFGMERPAQGPELVVQMKTGGPFPLGCGTFRRMLTPPPSEHRGTHVRAGFVLGSGFSPNVWAIPKPTVADIAPTLLGLLGFQSPSYMRGKSLADALQTSLPLTRDGRDGGVGGGYSEEEEAQVLERLHDLGYVE